MIEVIVQKPGDDIEFDKAVKKFKKLCNNDGFLQEIRERRYFEKPSDKKRRKIKEKIRRRK